MKKARNWFWGIFLVAAAAVLIVGQVVGFAQFGFWSILALVLLAAAFVQSLVRLNFPGLLVSGVLIYSIIQKPLGLFYISPWLLVLAALLAGIGLSLIISPKRFRRKYIYQNGHGHWENGHVEGSRWVSDEPWKRPDPDAFSRAEDGATFQSGGPVPGADEAGPGGETADSGTAPDAPPPPEREDDAGHTGHHGGGGQSSGSMELEAGDDENHPYAKVSFGDASRYIHGQAVESGLFEVNIGHMAVYFDGAKPTPGGMNIAVEVSLGALELFFPRHWNVRENVTTSLGAVEHDARAASPDPSAPLVMVSGNVNLGGLEIHYI